MKEIKNKKIDLRLTADEKQRLIEYAQRRNISMAEAIRQLCREIFDKGDTEK